MFALSEQEKLNAYYEAYTNLRYNFAKKRRELNLSQDMVSMLSGVARGTILKIEGSVSETQDIRLSSLIDVCLLFKVSIQEMFAMKPDIDSEESAVIAALLAKQNVSPPELPEALQNDFANYIGGNKHVSRDVFAAWHRIYTLRNNAEKKPLLQYVLGKKIEGLEVGASWNYKPEYHSKMYDFIKKLNGKQFELTYINPQTSICKRIS